MYTKLARGYARQLIEGKTSLYDFLRTMNDGGKFAMTSQFGFSVRRGEKDRARIRKKLERACRRKMNARIVSWNKEHQEVHMETVCGDMDGAVLTSSEEYIPLFHEPHLNLCSYGMKRDGYDLLVSPVHGPSMGWHAIVRMLERKGACAEDLDDKCTRALRLARKAMMTLYDYEEEYDLVLPFGEGAIAIASHPGYSQRDEGWRSRMPSVRTYLTRDMLDIYEFDSVNALFDFYAGGQEGGEERHRKLLIDAMSPWRTEQRLEKWQLEAANA